ncbi:MAG: replicative DNA helicase [Oscillospiraceae bacterium]|nr:replicative DNA helicase [Oscillospiraceae bacterium]
MPDFEQLSMPYSLDAEQTILGAILIDSDSLGMVMEQIKPECFYVEQHRALFTVITTMAASGHHIDAITVLDKAVNAHIFENAAEGRNYLANLVELVPTTANLASYCKIVANKYYIRSLAETAQKILHDIQNGETNAQMLLDSAEQQIFSIRQGRDISGLTPIREVVADTYNQIGRLAGPDREKYKGMGTGFAYLDSLISGLNKSDLILVAARPAMGKTAFALNLAQNVAKTHPDEAVCIFSLEMPRTQLAARLLSTSAQVDSNKLRNGRLSGDDWLRLAAGASYLSNMPIYIDDTASITVPQIKAKLRRIKNLGLVVIDYLGLIQSTLRTENKVQVVAEITRQLKIMAKELNVPVILLSQLSRGPESRTDKRPMLSDLRDSGSIEQDADIVLFLYRDAYYNKDSKTPNVAECIVAKNRHGECGTANLIWDGQFTRFSSMEKSDASA